MDEIECYPTVLEGGQVTIPAEVRTLLDIEKGDQLKVTIEHVEETD